MDDELDPNSPVLVHFYRAVVAHMDVWRQRMDATTNWAAATTAGMITFSFSTADSPHFVLLLTLGFNGMFLIMEARRYQIFDLWRRRFRVLNRYLIAWELDPKSRPDDEERHLALRALAVDLGRMVPHMGVRQAIGYRVRRNYGYVLSLVLVAWILKLGVHPTSAPSFQSLIGRAAIGGIAPGEVVAAAVAALIIIFAVLAISAPSGEMMDWADVPSPLDRWTRRKGP